jgi:hypothetical protein
MIGDYANQTFTHKAQNGTLTSEGLPNYSSSSIAGRWQYKRRLVRNSEGQEVVSEAQVYTETQVKVNDRLVHTDGTEHIVISVSPKVNLDGTTSHYEVAL